MIFAVAAFVLAATVVQVDVQTINLIAGTLIPLAVGVITKAKASSGTKALTNALLSAVAGAIAPVAAAQGRLDVKVFVASILTTFVASAATYYGVWKPTGVAGVVQQATADVGVGTVVPGVVEPDPAPLPDDGSAAERVVGHPALAEAPTPVKSNDYLVIPRHNIPEGWVLVALPSDEVDEETGDVEIESNEG